MISYKLLLIEDNEDDAVAIREMLDSARAARFELEWVGHLAAALDRLALGNIDAVLLDLSLPDSHGFASVEKILRQTQQTPIIVLTVLDDEEIAIKTVQAGAQDYLTKGSFDATLLGRAVRYAVERKRMEQERADFTAMIAHDLRSPLMSIIAIGEMMHDGRFGPVSKEQQDWLRIVESSGRRLIDLVSDFLDLSKLEAGHIHLQKAPTDLHALLASVVQSHEAQSLRAGVALTLHVDAALPPMEIDAHRIEQVLYNLLGNALKFTPKNGRIEVRAGRRKEMIAVEVEDTGIGIAADEIGQLFRKYRQASNAKSLAAKGTGLGLIICKMIVEAHNGAMRARSDEGKGTIFTFTLPVQSSAAHAHRA